MAQKNESSGAWIFFAIVSWLLVWQFGTGMFVFLLCVWIFYFLYKLGSRTTSKEDSNSGSAIRNQNGTVTLSFEVGTSYSNEQNTFYAIETNVQIGNRSVPLYLCYSSKKSTHPHVITTSSSIGNPDLALRANMGYWPSYSSIQSNDRATYLLWHETGRKNPNADIGLVFIYFYGLEYRAIKEEQNHREIYEELVRLYEIYGEKSGSFSGYCTAFISWLMLKNPQWDYTKDIQRTNISQSSSSLAKEVLWRSESADSSQLSVASMALRSDVLQIPRSLSAFSTEIIRRFKSEFSKLDLSNDDFKEELKYDYYRTASALKMNPTVDLKSFKPNAKTKKKLEDLWEKILDQYMVFNKVQKMDSSIAALVSPTSNQSNPALANFTNFSGSKQCNINELLTALKSEERTALTLAESKTIALLFLEKGVLVEPDPNITNRAYKLSEEIILYKGDNTLFRIEQWKKAVVLLDISASIAFSDEESEGAEIKHTVDFIGKQFKLNQTELKRLEMRAIVLKKTKISAHSIAKKLGSTMNQKEASTLAKFLFSIAAHDGVINSLELKALEKTFKAIEVPITSLDVLVKEFTENNKGTLVKLKSAGKKSSKSGTKIPTKLNDTAIVLNETALQTALADAEEVSRILSAVFTEEEPEVETKKEKAYIHIDHPSDVTHLGNKESSIISTLSAKDRWDLVEVEAICKSNGMMYGAFLNKVNDYYEQKTGSPLLEEDGDELIVALELISSEVHIA